MFVRLALVFLAALGLLVVAGAQAESEWHAVLYSIRPDGTGRTLVLDLDPPVYSLVRSPDGKKIAYTRRDGFYVADNNGDHAVRIDGIPWGDVNFSPDGKFSPDGTRLAIESHTVCGERCVYTKVWVVNADGTGLHLVAEGRHASWSPDGTRLVYMGALQIHVVSADGGDDTMIAEGMNPEWAPRGERIAFLGVGHARGYMPPCVIDADGHHTKCLEGVTAVNGLVWSNHGAWLAFIQATPPRLAMMRSGGGGVKRLLFTGPRPWPLAWSPNDRWLAYASARFPRQIYVRSLVHPRREHRVTNEPDQGNYTDVRWRTGRISYVIYEP